MTPAAARAFTIGVLTLVLVILTALAARAATQAPLVATQAGVVSALAFALIIGAGLGAIGGWLIGRAPRRPEPPR